MENGNIKFWKILLNLEHGLSGIYERNLEAQLQ